jgi:hypothetical protein
MARESDGLGERLEQVAQEVESAYRGRRSADTVGDLLAGETGVLPAPGAAPAHDPAHDPANDQDTEPAVAEEPAPELVVSGPLSWTPQHGFRAEPSPPPVQRAEAAPGTEVGVASTEPALPGPLGSDGQPLTYPVVADAASPGPEETQSGPGAGRPEGSSRPAFDEIDEATLARLAERIGARLVVSPVDTRSPELLDQLAFRLYGRLRSRMRRELISDRERVGLLTEFH